MWGQLAVSLQSGNEYIWAVVTLAFIGTVIILERFIMLQGVYYIDFSKFLRNFKRSMHAEDLDRVINLCKSASHTSLPYIALKAVEASEKDPTIVRGTIEEESIDFLPKLETRLSLLPSLATLIMLVGILGTIDGLWSAFDSIEILDTSEKQVRLSQGIAGSLNPTSLALIICMIFLALHQILKSTAIKISERIHYGVTVLTNFLVPQEVATYMVPMQLPSAAAPVATEVQETTSAETISPKVADEQEEEEEEEDEDDNFDDAEIEDIKDEEEII